MFEAFKHYINSEQFRTDCQTGGFMTGGAILGGAAGLYTVSLTGLTAAGMVTPWGAGIGCKASTVGATIGATLGGVLGLATVTIKERISAHR